MKVPNSKGQWLYNEAVKTGKPIFDYRKQDEHDIPVNTFSYSDLVNLFGVKLTEEQRKNDIYGFRITKATRGCVPLYQYNFETSKVISQKEI